MYRFGFFMDQIAGHITNYHNLRSLTEKNSEIEADWYEIIYLKPGGSIELFRKHLAPFLPTCLTGVLRGTLEMRNALRHFRQYDAILTNVSVAGLFSRTLARIPTLIDFDCTPIQLDRMPTYNSSQNDPKPLADLKYKLTLCKFQSAALLQAWSNWARQSIIEDYGISPEKVVVNPPGVNLSFWNSAVQTRSSTTTSPLRVLFVGGDFRRKGGPLLLEWYKNQDQSRYELHIVTREPVQKVPGVYVYRDMQPNTPSLLDLYRNSDLFVLPSLGECFGIATVEAMAAGLPVIATDIGGTADIIEPDRNGLIIRADDVGALTEAIAGILKDEPRRLRMGTQSRLLAEERFDLEKNAGKTLNYLKQISLAQENMSSILTG